MKFKVTMKDPDTLEDAITDAVRDEVSAMGLADDEAEAIRKVRIEKARAVADQWFEYGEYLTIEIDTDTKTATVCVAQ